MAHAYRPFQELRSAPTPAQLAIAAARHMMQTVSASLSPAALLYLVTLVCVAFVALAVAVALAIAAQPWSIVALPVLILVIRAAPITSRGAEPMPAA